MTMSRTFKRWVCRALIGLLVFMQLAVAAYACPSLSPSSSHFQQEQIAGENGVQSMAGMAIADSENGIVDCDQMADGLDKNAPNLCAEHCRYGQQSDQTSTLTVPAALLMALYFAPLVPNLTAELRPAAATPSALIAASPPHAILHCCFRI